MMVFPPEAAPRLGGLLALLGSQLGQRVGSSGTRPSCSGFHARAYPCGSSRLADEERLDGRLRKRRHLLDVDEGFGGQASSSATGRFARTVMRRAAWRLLMSLISMSSVYSVVIGPSMKRGADHRWPRMGANQRNKNNNKSFFSRQPLLRARSRWVPPRAGARAMRRKRGQDRCTDPRRYGPSTSPAAPRSRRSISPWRSIGPALTSSRSLGDPPVRLVVVVPAEASS